MLSAKMRSAVQIETNLTKSAALPNTAELTRTMQRPLLQVLLCLAVIWNSIVAAAPLQFTLYHQVLHPASAKENADKDITQRGIILYDTTTRTASYESLSPSADLSKDTGVYRIGLYNDKTKQLTPAAFTK